MAETKKRAKTKPTEPPADWVPDPQCLKLAIENVAQGAGAAIRQARADAKKDLVAYAEDAQKAFGVVLDRLEAVERALAVTREDADLVRRALLAHDGPTLRPEWPREEQRRLTGALDRLRLELLVRHGGG